MGGKEPRARDVFVVPHLQGYLLYAPLAGRVVFVSGGALRQLKRYLDTGDAAVVDSGLRERLGGLEWLDPQPVPLPRDPEAPYEPSQITLFLGNRCSLRCRYCYASAGESGSRRLPAHVAFAAIELAAANAEQKEQELVLGFHGGGEPTMEWDLLTRCVEFARKTSAVRRFGLRTGLATNGMVSEDHARWIAEHFTAVTLSLDGPEEIQDRMRPTISGAGSFARVRASAGIFKAEGTPVVVRCTVTRANVERLPELVDFFADLSGARIIHFEPVFASGRARDHEDFYPDRDLFITRFFQAMDRAHTRGIRVRHSVSRLYAVYPSFCGCSQDPFNVTQEGDLSACFEVCERAHEQAALFVFGAFHEASGTFDIDREKLARLRGLTVHSRPMCSRCIAKWNCSGDCPAKWVGGEPEAARCEINRGLTLELLRKTLDPQKCLTV